MSRRPVAIAIVLSTLILAGCQMTPDDKPATARPTWVDAWQASPTTTAPRACVTRARSHVAIQSNGRAQTYRFAIWPTVAGTAVKLRLSNRLSSTPLNVVHVSVAAHKRGTAIVEGTSRDVLFGGARAVTIPAFSELISDELEVAARPDKPIAVSIAVIADGGPTWHPLGPETSAATPAELGDRTHEVRGSSFQLRIRSYVVLAGLEVRAVEPTTAIVAFGDSLTDGGVGTVTTNWVERFAARLRAARRPFAVVNAGIECNALLRGGGPVAPKAADRFDADVLDRTGVSHVIVFLGTNDLYSGTAAEITAALEGLAQRARAKGIRVIGATLLPRTGIAAGPETTRRAVNQWIRTTDAYDTFIDFDAVIRSRTAPSAMNPSYNGDDIHPNDKGHVAMGNAVNLALFEK